MENLNETKETVDVKILYHDKDMPRLEKIAVGDWIDLYTAKDVTFKKKEPGQFYANPPYEFKLIPLGVSMQLPAGYEAHVVPRSSTFKKYEIIQANSVGIIDESYAGNNDVWKFPAVYLGTGELTIPKYTRLCQFRIVKKMPSIQFGEVKNLEGEDRGGFGSTGS